LALLKNPFNQIPAQQSYGLKQMLAAIWNIGQRTLSLAQSAS
jgi:hypothetical protein